MDKRESYLFLAEKREMVQTTSSLFFDVAITQDPDFQNKFSFISLFRELTLAPEARFSLDISPIKSTLILPLVGGVLWNDFPVFVGEVQVVTVENIVFENPFLDDNITFLVMNFLGNIEVSSKKAFDLDTAQNTLLPLVKIGEHTLWLGKFDTRAGATLTLPYGRAWVHALDGAFEVAEQRLAARDTLALWGQPTLEFEALSPESMLLILG